MIYYTGIGSRRISDNVFRRMVNIADALAHANITLRSGAAEGSDTAFECGCDGADGPKEIFLPWKGFNNSTSPLYNIPEQAFEIAADVYGVRWRFLKDAVKRLMARNIQQVLGENLDAPSRFVVCFTPDGCERASARSSKTGGTGQAIQCADECDIPVFNLKNEGAELRLVSFILEEVVNEA